MFADDSRPGPSAFSPAATATLRTDGDPARLAFEVRDLARQIRDLLQTDDACSRARWLDEAARLNRRVERLRSQVRRHGHQPLSGWLDSVAAELEERRCELLRPPVSV